MKKYIIIIMVLAAAWARGQSITAAEYYIDNDPGVGLASSVALTAADSVTVNFTAPTTGLSIGCHNLCLRVKNAYNVWSIVDVRTFCLNAPTLSPLLGNLTNAEYYFDTDPGNGAGISIPITTSDSVSISNYAIPTTGQTIGFHNLCIRTRNDQGLWSIVDVRVLYLGQVTSVANTTITQAEYYFDTDPSNGAGTNIPITAGDSVTVVNYAIPTTALSQGFHNLAIRTKNAEGIWSIGDIRTLYLTAPFAATNSNIVAAEYYFDTDPGNGAAAPIAVTAADSVSINPVLIPTDTLSVGFHNLAIRTKSGQSTWSLPEVRTFYVYRVPTTISTTIDKAEYFVDIDPGVGNATPFNINSPSDTLSFTNALLAMPCLATGNHTLYIRVRYSSGIWGLHEPRTFALTSAATNDGAMNGLYVNSTSCGFGNNETITLSVKNSGSNTIPIGAAVVNLVLTGATTASYTALNTSTILAGDSVRIFVTGVNLSAIGATTITATLSVCNDPLTTNNVQTTTTNNTGNNTVSAFINSPATEINCTRSSIQLTASGGTTYSWENGTTGSTRTITSAGTYLVTATAGLGCSGTQSITITSNTSLPTASVSGRDTVCSNTSTSLVASGGASYLWSTGANTASLSISPTASTTYGVTITGSNGCTASTTKRVVLDDVLNNSRLSSTTTLLNCTTTNTNLSATGGVAYLWDNNTTAFSRTVTTGGTYQVTITSSSGCTTTRNVTINRDITPPTLVVSNDTTICSGQSVTLRATSNGSTYTWNNGASGTTNTVSPSATSVYTVIVTGANGCTSGAAINVNVNTLGLTNVGISTPTTQLNCTTTSIVLSATGGATYTWDNNLGIATRTVTSAGTYTVTATANGCSGTARVIISQDFTRPTAAISGADTTCVGNSVQLTATGGTAYTWSNGSSAASILVTPPSTTAYSVTVTGANGCTASAIKTVVIGNTLGVGISSSSTQLNCSNPSISLLATGGAAYTWDNNLTNANRTITSAGTYTVTATANGCTGTARVIISQDFTRPTPAISGSDTACVGNSVQLIATGGNSYSWSNGSSGATISVMPTSTTTYIVTATATNGCTATALKTIVIGNTLSVGISSSTTQLNCATTSIPLTATGGATYTWDNNLTNANRTITSAGTYTVTATANGCTGTARVIISQDFTRPTAAISGADTTCVGNSVQLTASGGTSFTWNTGSNSSNISVTPTTTTSYSVTVTGANGCTATAIKTVVIGNTLGVGISSTNTQLNCTTTSIALLATGGAVYTWDNNLTNPNRTITSAGTYTVTATANGCTGTARVVITLDTIRPTASIAAPDSVCTGVPFILTASGGASYFWSTGGNTTSISAQTNNAASYSVIATAANGCTRSAVRLVNIVPPVTASFDTIKSGLRLSCTNRSTNATTYTWDFGDQQQSSQTSPVHVYANYGTYTVSLTATNRCGSTTSTRTVILVNTGTLELLGLTNLRIMPNPTTDFFQVDMQGQATKDMQIQIVNDLGQVVQADKFNFSGNERRNYGSPSWAKGVYFVLIQNKIVGKVLIN
jgi:PKD domain/Secretion system C-terminal sorting domain